MLTDIPQYPQLAENIDPDLFDVFVREKIYLDYARQFLDPAQIDEGG